MGSEARRRPAGRLGARGVAARLLLREGLAWRGWACLEPEPAGTAGECRGVAPGRSGAAQALVRHGAA